MTSHAPNQKRKLADNTSDDVSRKRTRTSRDTLRSVRRLESEPATRDVTPVDVPRTNSVPLKRKAFDGVHVPTLREVSHRRTVQRAETSKNTVDTGRSHESVPQAHALCVARRRNRTPQSPLPPSVGSDEDDLDWENFRVYRTPSEADVDRSLMTAQPSSSPPTRTSTPHDSDDLPAGSSPPKAVLQSRRSPSLRRPKTRLDALRDVYSSVANGASQIPFPELVQATKLVHQIGAVLTEQMGKKMGHPK
ncbi:hypothetical protein JVT61DRAFT_1159 [Boletus reticuloceps]|uniref:Uncharacterized protein n=1 Tax=Boletus reticuloceps TaxID=495285 RepID=A0A8I3A9Q0_9AGAM|nr:hypothetical protein JVT61DRAFT_1159 [Boletus reticuloceps]